MIFKCEDNFKIRRVCTFKLLNFHIHIVYKFKEDIIKLLIPTSNFVGVYVCVSKKYYIVFKKILKFFLS